MPFQILEAESRSILSPVSGYLAEAGFTHSLSPTRNCTFGCSYCYVPTMRVQAGLRPEDWAHWGQWTPPSNAAPAICWGERVAPASSDQLLTPLDPYQPAEAEELLFPCLLAAVRRHPPRVFVIQTRGPLITRDLDLLQAIAARTTLRVETLRQAGIETSVAIAPILLAVPKF